MLFVDIQNKTKSYNSLTKFIQIKSGSIRYATVLGINLAQNRLDKLF